MTKKNYFKHNRITKTYIKIENTKIKATLIINTIIIYN